MSFKKRPKPRSKGLSFDFAQDSELVELPPLLRSAACPDLSGLNCAASLLPLGVFLKSSDGKKRKLSAAILAGGKNSRMGGENKAFLCFEGKSLIQRTISVLKPSFSEIFIVTNSPRLYDQHTNDTIIIEDSIKEIGPLGGMYAALSQTKSEAVFFVACDMPFLHNEVIEQQIREFEKMAVDVFVPRIGKHIEPLHGIYHRRIVAELLLFLQESQRHSVREFLQKVKTEYWDLDDTVANRKYFTNVNTVQELQRISGAKFKEGGEFKDRHKGTE